MKYSPILVLCIFKYYIHSISILFKCLNTILCCLILFSQFNSNSISPPLTSPRRLVPVLHLLSAAQWHPAFSIILISHFQFQLPTSLLSLTSLKRTSLTQNGSKSHFDEKGASMHVRASALEYACALVLLLLCFDPEVNQHQCHLVPHLLVPMLEVD